MNFNIIEYLMDNFTKEERDWISETSQKISISDDWDMILPESDYTLQSDGFSEPMDDLDFSSPQP